MNYHKNLSLQYNNLMQTLEEENICKIFTCDKEKGPYGPCCSPEHNSYLHVIMNGLDDLFSANKNRGKNEENLRYLNSTESVIYYSNLKI